MRLPVLDTGTPNNTYSWPMAERLVRPSGIVVVAVSFEEPAASRNETPHSRKPLEAQFVSTVYPGHR